MEGPPRRAAWTGAATPFAAEVATAARAGSRQVNQSAAVAEARFPHLVIRAHFHAYEKSVFVARGGNSHNACP